MDGIGAGTARGIDDFRCDEVAFRGGRWSDVDRLVGVPCKGRIAVGIRIYSHCGDAHFFRCAHDAQGDFSAIGDQDLLNGLDAGVVHSAEVVKNRRKEKGKKKGQAIPIAPLQPSTLAAFRPWGS